MGMLRDKLLGFIWRGNNTTVPPPQAASAEREASAPAPTSPAPERPQVDTTELDRVQIGDGLMMRHAIGHSAQGWHYAIDLTEWGRVGGQLAWSSALPSRDEAVAASTARQDEIRAAPLLAFQSQDEPTHTVISGIPGMKEIVQRGTWTEVESDMAGWQDVRSVVARGPDGFWAKIEVRDPTFSGDLIREEPSKTIGPFASLQEAQGHGADAVAEMLEDWRGLWSPPPGYESGSPDYEPPPPHPTLGQCPTVDAIVARGMQRMVQHVPKDLSAGELLLRAGDLDQEAAVEGGWDNYTTAANLRHFAEAHRLAAAIGNWEAPQAPTQQARHDIIAFLRDVRVMGEDLDDDVGEHLRTHRMTMASAIGDIDQAEMEKVIDELAAENCLGNADPGALKDWHREAVAREATELERWRSGQDHDLDHDDDLGL